MAARFNISVGNRRDFPVAKKRSVSALANDRITARIINNMFTIRQENLSVPHRSVSNTAIGAHALALEITARLSRLARMSKHGAQLVDRLHLGEQAVEGGEEGSLHAGGGNVHAAEGERAGGAGGVRQGTRS